MALKDIRRRIRTSILKMTSVRVFKEEGDFYAKVFPSSVIIDKAMSAEEVFHKLPLSATQLNRAFESDFNRTKIDHALIKDREDFATTKV